MGEQSSPATPILHWPTERILVGRPCGNWIQGPFLVLTVYKTKTCAYCPMVAKYLTAKGTPFKEVYVDDDPVIRRDLFNKTGMLTVPVTTDGETYVVGWNPAKLAHLAQ